MLALGVVNLKRVIRAEPMGDKSNRPPIAGFLGAQAVEKTFSQVAH
jgi:hypothetical protein